MNVISLIVSFFTELQNRGLLLYTYTFLFRLLTNDKRNMVRNISQIFVECNVFSKLQLKTNRMCCFYYSTSVIGDLFFFAFLFLSHFSSIALYRVGIFFVEKKMKILRWNFAKKVKKKIAFISIDMKRWRIVLIPILCSNKYIDYLNEYHIKNNTNMWWFVPIRSFN